MGYSAALSLQERLVEMKQREGLCDILLLVEHPHIFTLGRGGRESNVVSAGEVPVRRTSRGGDVTYHGPGQMVAYPLVDLKSRLRKDVHRYLRFLELAAIRTLRAFGLRAERRPPWTGVWVENKKIVSIGVAVRRGITYHGLALNVNTDLSYFDRIVPCGLHWAEMTSVEKELGRKAPMEEIKKEFLCRFMRTFRYAESRELCREDIPTGSGSERRAAPTISA